MTSLENLCGSVGICANLHIFDLHDRPLHVVQGTKEKISIGPVENVAKVQTTGSGCYTIFEEENFKGEHFCWTGNEKEDLNNQSIFNSRVVR